VWGGLLKVIKLKNNAGLGNALRIATEKSSFELIARMDSDDVSIHDRFEQQLNILVKHPEIDIIGGDITEFIGEEKNIVGKRTVPRTDGEIKEYMKKRCAMNHVSVMYKKSAVVAAGGYQEWFWNEDYYLWIRMQLNNAVFANTGTVLVKVRVGGKMYQRRGGKKYFNSEVSLQRYMLDQGMIRKTTFFINCGKRMMIQRILPSNIRGWVFRKFARN